MIDETKRETTIMPMAATREGNAAAKQTDAPQRKTDGHQTCPKCGRQVPRTGTGMGGGLLPDDDELWCQVQGGRSCRLVAATRARACRILSDLIDETANSDEHAMIYGWLITAIDRIRK